MIPMLSSSFFLSLEDIWCCSGLLVGLFPGRDGDAVDEWEDKMGRL